LETKHIAKTKGQLAGIAKGHSQEKTWWAVWWWLRSWGASQGRWALGALGASASTSWGTTAPSITGGKGKKESPRQGVPGQIRAIITDPIHDQGTNQKSAISSVMHTVIGKEAQ